MVRLGNSNSNWRGGSSSIKSANDLSKRLSEFGQVILSEMEGKYRKEPGLGCWIWVGSVFRCNGRARHRGDTAARFMYLLCRGLIGDLCVLHTCDNVQCVNPSHLFLGTNQENSADMVAKGRNPPQKGSLNFAAKLNEEKVREIRLRLKEGEKQNELAKEFKVSKSTINLISKGKGWEL